MEAEGIRRFIAQRAAQDVEDGMVVNLGIGIPTLVADFVPAGREVVYHSENGLIGLGPAPRKGMEDPDLINASKDPVTLLAGASGDSCNRVRRSSFTTECAMSSCTAKMSSSVRS